MKGAAWVSGARSEATICPFSATLETPAGDTRALATIEHRGVPMRESTRDMRLKRSLCAAVWLPLALAAGAGQAQTPQQPTRRFGDIVAPESEPIPPDEGVVRGRVVDTRSGLPVADATVLLVPTFVPGREKSSVTDERGRYEVRGLEPGAYRIFGDADGFLTQPTQRGPMETATHIEVPGGQITTGVAVHLQRAAVISGRVYDASGEGFPGIQVDVLAQQTYPDGPRYIQMATASTDDLGLFRAVDLRPGEYVVKATPGGAIRRPDPERPEVYAWTFYPATTRLEEAQPLRVNAGQELFSIDFSIATVEPADIGGIILDATGDPLAGLEIALQPTDQPTGTVRTATSYRNGTFQLAGVIPADYELSVTHPSGGRLRHRLDREDDWSLVEIVFPRTTHADGRVRHDGVGPRPFKMSRMGIVTYSALGDPANRRGRSIRVSRTLWCGLTARSR